MEPLTGRTDHRPVVKTWTLVHILRMTIRHKKYKSRISGVALSVAIATGVPNSAASADRTVFDMRDDWRAFFEILQEEHDNPFFATPRAVFLAEQEQFLEAIPDMSREEQIAEFARLMALTGDGHTFLPMHPLPFDGFPEGPAFHPLPVRFELFDDGLFIVGAGPDHEHLIGAEVVRIGHLATDAALGRVMTLLPQDAVNFSRDFAPEWLMLSEVLSALDITQDAEAAEIAVIKNNKAAKVSLEPLSPAYHYDWVKGMDNAPTGPDGPLAGWKFGARHTPLWREDASQPFRSASIDGDVLYFQINELRDSPMRTIRDETLALAEKAKEDNLATIIDLRRCIGGDGSLIPAMMATLDKAIPIAVLISRRTHSAGVMLVSALEQQTDAVFIGQATADRPNHYGETNIFILPDSKLPVVYASEYYETSTPDDHRPFRTPDISIPYIFNDYERGIDRTLNTAIDYLNRK